MEDCFSREAVFFYLFQMIKEKLQKLDIFPLMGEHLDQNNSQPLDFSANNAALMQLELKNTEQFDAFVFQQMMPHKKYGYGGYLENRIIYLRSEHFQSGDSRSIHLGVDIWAEAFHPVYAPLDGVVHSFKNNDNFGDYGPTIILEHDIAGEKFYTLYGHLSLNSLSEIQVGDSVAKGKSFCELGPFPENGDWPPHLHFQLITDMEGKEGDFPGVCSPNEQAHYQKICLDPTAFL